MRRPQRLAFLDGPESQRQSALKQHFTRLCRLPGYAGWEGGSDKPLQDNIFPEIIPA